VRNLSDDEKSILSSAGNAKKSDADMTELNQIPSTPEQEKRIDEALGLRKVGFRIQEKLASDMESISLIGGMNINYLYRVAVQNFVDNVRKALIL